jgi:OFA family oxalate/formate antiporter-like MFS transporter
MRRDWTDIPFAPRAWPFFYGWVILAATTVGTLASLPGQTMGVGVFTDHLIAALDVSRSGLSTAYFFGTLGSALILPAAGRLLDRIGARISVVISSVALGVAMVLLSQSDRIADLSPVDREVWGSSLAGVIVATVAFFLMRFFGQGCLTLVSRTALSKWFNHRRGLAVAIAGVFIAFGFNSSPVILDEILQAFGWRGAALLLAAGAGVGMAVLGWVFYRDNPEECGLVMDGQRDPAWQARMAARQPTTYHEFNRGEALSTFAFWAFSIGLATQGLIVTAVTFHIASLGDDMGLDREAAYAVFWPMSFFGVPANFVGSWLSDRIPQKWLLIAMVAFQALGTVGSLTFGDELGRWVMIVGYGTSLGLFGCLLTVPWPRFYGRRNLGAINGVVASMTVVASAVAPAFFAIPREALGDYTLIKVASLAFPVAILFVAPFADNPQLRYRPQPTVEPA